LRLTETIFSYEYYSKNLQLNSKKEENEELIVQLKDAEERVRNQRSEVS
jgi:hypothetical protein